MPNVYTRTGDKGQTGLFGGTRVAKQSVEVEAYGTLDEANAAIGAAKAIADEATRGTLHAIQQRLFVLAAELASDERGRQILDDTISSTDVVELEQLIDMCMQVVGPQRRFVVPGRDPFSAALHQARTVVRRAERRMLAMAERTPVRAELIAYVNRLSDAVYALARAAEHRHDVAKIEGIVRRVVTAALAENDQSGLTSLARFDLGTAKRMAEAAEARAGEIGVPVVFAAVDAGGNLILLHRMADSLLGSLDIAINKAFTAAAFKLPTDALKDPAAPTGDLHGIQNSNNGRVVVFGGGMPIFVDGTIRGGIGVSGGTVEEDMIIAGHALTSAHEERLP